jgi:chlorobactene glucosyltransferase
MCLRAGDALELRRPGSMLIALTLLTAVIVASIARDLVSASRVPLLAPRPDATVTGSLVTVIIPARDEAQRIGRCLDGLAAQRLTDLDVVVLDDGSTDGTAELARSYRDRLPGLRVITGAPLPDGWAGKCWACWQAAATVQSPWLLFLDADTAPQPGMIAALLQYATTHRVDLLSLLPLLELRSFWERVIMPSFTGIIQAVFPLDRVNDPRSRLAMANGQCILVRRDVYMATDGHRAVRDSVLEDVRLAQTIKWAGYRLRLVGGPRLMRVRMYTNFREVAEGLRKNAIAGASAGGIWRTAWGGLRQALLAFAPLTVIIAGGVLAALGSDAGSMIALWGGGLLLLTLAYWGYVVRRLNQLHPLWALCFPLGTACYFALSAVALLGILSGRGVSWKGRSYKK